MTDDEGPVFESRDAPRSQARVEEDEARRGPGAPAHAPNEGTRGAVTMLAAFRIPHHRICAALNLTKPTLYKYYARELENAETIIDAEVLKGWMKLVKAGDSLTINRYMERKFKFSDDTGGVASALPSVVVIDNIPNDQRAITAPAAPPVIDVGD